MGEVIQLFKKAHHPDDIKAKIVDNLKNMHHCKWVNVACAISNVNDVAKAFEIIDNLCEENVIERNLIPIPNGPVITMYRYNIFNDLIN